MTVLFCDLVGATQLATRLDPEDLRDVLLDYLKTCAQVVESFGGYVAKYQGDGLLAYFGYPQAQEDAAERAARAGLGLITAVPSRRIRDDAALQVRVGISTGLTVVGDLLGEGGGAREETVIGEVPVLAARLQQSARPCTVLIAESTRKLLGHMFELEDLGLHDLKGFADPVRLWSLVSTRDLDSRFEGTRGQGAEQGIGRDQELALLINRWESALAAEGQIVGLFGEAGIGKSRLCAMLQQHIGAAPHEFLRLQCSPLHTSSALYPVIANLERAIGLTPDLSTETKLARLEKFLTERELAGSLPLFAALLFRSADERHPSSAMSAEELKQRTLDALADLLLSFAGSQPALAIIEDAHWIDPSTEDFLRRCIDRVASARLLLIVTYRPEFRRDWLNSGNFTALGLNRLHRLHATDMVRGVAGSTVLPPELVDYIVTRTDGVPLFIQEVTKNVLESDLLRAEDGQVILDHLHSHAIPTTLQDSLLARLDRLASVKEIAQIGATVGREFSHKLLQVITSGYSGTLEAALGQLVKADLIRVRGRPPEATYIFKHALLQDAAYSTLVRSKRRELHLRIAKALQEHFPQQAETEPELVAHHLTEAGVGTQATEWWEKAGKLAVQRSANFEAVNHFNKALAVLARDPASAMRDERELELRSSLRAPLYVTTGYASAQMEANYAQMEQLCERLGATAKLLRVLWGQSAMTLVRSEFGLTLARMERFMELAERAGDANTMIAGSRVLDYMHLARGDLRTSRAGLERAIDAYDRRMEHSSIATYDMSPVPTATCMLFLAVQQLGHLDQAAMLTDQALGGAKQSGHPPTVAAVLYHVALFWMIRGDAIRVRQATDDLLTVMQTNDIRLYNSYIDILGGWTTAKAGDLEEGLRRMRRGAAARKAMRVSIWMPFYLTREAELLNEHERFDETLELLRTTEAGIEEKGERYAAAELHRLRALALMGKRAAPAEIERDFQQALEIARQQEARLWELRAAVSYAEYLRGDGRVREAHALLAPVYGWFTEGLDTRDLETAKRLLETLAQRH